MAPTAAENLPAPQLRHDDCPSSAENLPAAHGWQTASEIPPFVSVYLPTPHRVHELIPTALVYLPPAHSWHTVKPVAFEYDPTTQFTQAAA